MTGIRPFTTSRSHKANIDQLAVGNEADMAFSVLVNYALMEPQFLFSALFKQRLLCDGWSIASYRGAEPDAEYGQIGPLPCSRCKETGEQLVVSAM